MRVDITALYCCLDDFVKLYEEWERHQLIDSGRKRRRAGKLSLSEMLLIMVLLHADSCKNCKCFYIYGIGHKYRDCFAEIPACERFVALQKHLFAPLSVLLHMLTAQAKEPGFMLLTVLA